MKVIAVAAAVAAFFLLAASWKSRVVPTRSASADGLADLIASLNVENIGFKVITEFYKIPSGAPLQRITEGFDQGG